VEERAVRLPTRNLIRGIWIQGNLMAKRTAAGSFVSHLAT
jgi:hypothetical protein